MEVELFKQVEIAGVIIDVTAKADVTNGYDSFSYECGSSRGLHREYYEEVNEVYDLQIDGDLKEQVTDCLLDSGLSKWNPFFYLYRWYLVRKVKKEFAKLDADQLWDNDEILKDCDFTNDDF